MPVGSPDPPSCGKLVVKPDAPGTRRQPDDIVQGSAWEET